MAFLQINNPDGTSGIKRPFRLSDLQDVWNGIKSLFRALAGQDFRIISGFDLEGGVYTSGTVWYNGELYEYDSATYPITPLTTKVSFGSIAQDDRVWQGGDTRPFASRFICGGDDYSGVAEFTDFVASIERYKSYLGNGSVTAAKLADGSVTTPKLADNSVTMRALHGSQKLLQCGTSSITVSSSASPVSLNFLLANAPYVSGIEVSNNISTLSIRIENESNISYPLIPIFVRNNNTSSSVQVQLWFYANGTLRFKATLSSTIPANTEKVVMLASGGTIGYAFIDGYTTVEVV